MATAIEWTRGEDGSAGMTWNPLVGCRAYSPGCAHCYAETMSKRLRAMAEKDIADGKDPGRKRHYINVINDKGRWNGGVELVPEALTDPFSWKKPRRVFVNSMSDLFYGDAADERAAKAGGYPFEPVPFEYIDKVFAIMALCPQHTFQILTKRPERMSEYCSTRTCHPFLIPKAAKELGQAVDVDIWRAGMSWPLLNVWLGTSCENQATAEERIPHLLRCPAAVRFLSCEPLLGPIDIKNFENRYWRCDSCEQAYDFACAEGRDLSNSECSDCDGGRYGEMQRTLHWVIVGGESGSNARPMHPDWARSLRDQCQAAGVAYFFKQWGEWSPMSTTDGRQLLPFGSYVVPGDGGNGFGFIRSGKKAAGRLLDGRTWDEFPKVEASHA